MSSYHPRDDRKEKNLPPPPSSFRPAKNKNVESRKIRNIATAADYAELKRAYTFVPEKKESSSSITTTTTWQERMANHYHSQLYKEYVLADFRRPPQVGLRWRTKSEVETEKGHKTCGNKHCSSYLQTGIEKQQSYYPVLETNQRLLKEYYQNPPSSEVRERCLLERLPNGIGLHDYEVNFGYEEGGQQKNELVKLRLCLRCAPLLFQTKGPNRCLQARLARDKTILVDSSNPNGNDELQQRTKAEQPTTRFDESTSSSSSEREHRKREKRRKQKKKNNKKNRHNRKRSMSQSESDDDNDEDEHSTRYRRSRKRERKHHHQKKRHKKSSR